MYCFRNYVYKLFVIIPCLMSSTARHDTVEPLPAVQCSPSCFRCHRQVVWRRSQTVAQGEAAADSTPRGTRTSTTRWWVWLITYFSVINNLLAANLFLFRILITNAVPNFLLIWDVLIKAFQSINASISPGLGSRWSGPGWVAGARWGISLLIALYCLMMDLSAFISHASLCSPVTYIWPPPDPQKHKMSGP